MDKVRVSAYLTICEYEARDFCSRDIKQTVPITQRTQTPVFSRGWRSPASPGSKPTSSRDPLLRARIPPKRLGRHKWLPVAGPSSLAKRWATPVVTTATEPRVTAPRTHLNPLRVSANTNWPSVSPLTYPIRTYTRARQTGVHSNPPAHQAWRAHVLRDGARIFLGSVQFYFSHSFIPPLPARSWTASRRPTGTAPNARPLTAAGRSHRLCPLLPSAASPPSLCVSPSRPPPPPLPPMCRSPRVLCKGYGPSANLFGKTAGRSGAGSMLGAAANPRLSYSPEVTSGQAPPMRRPPLAHPAADRGLPRTPYLAPRGGTQPRARWPAPVFPQGAREGAPRSPPCVPHRPAPRPPRPRSPIPPAARRGPAEGGRGGAGRALPKRCPRRKPPSDMPCAPLPARLLAAAPAPPAPRRALECRLSARTGCGRQAGREGTASSRVGAASAPARRGRYGPRPPPRPPPQGWREPAGPQPAGGRSAGGSVGSVTPAVGSSPSRGWPRLSPLWKHPAGASPGAWGPKTDHSLGHHWGGLPSLASTLIIGTARGPAS